MGIAISSRVYNRIGGVGKVGGIVGKRRIIYASLFILIGLLNPAGDAVSGSFLFIIGVANTIILWRILKRRRHVSHL